MTLSRHPGPCPDLEPLWSDSIRVAIRRFARRACRRVTADNHPDLGPRSLDPDRTFWCAYAECIWSQTSPADFCNCYDVRALSPSSHDPRRDGRLDALPFLELSRPLPCGSGDRRRAAHRPFASTPVSVPPGFHQVFPTAIPIRTRHLRELPRRSCSGDRRARVRGPREGRVYCRAREARFRVSRVRCMRFEECMRTTFPSSASSGHPLSPVHRREGRRPVPDGGPNQDLRSDADPRRPTSSRRPGCLPPLRSAVSVRTRIAPNPNLPRRSLAHAAHTLSPGWGECLHGHCKHQSAVTRDPWHSRNKRLCYRWVRSFRICRAWD